MRKLAKQTGHSRILKFRAWDKRFNEMDFGFGDLLLRINEKDFSEPMQFTGLHDKNGKEIFEGDILRIYGWTKEGLNTGNTEYFVEVKWERMCWSCGSKSLYNYSTIGWANIEVIGNIYKNPELL